MFVKCHFDYNPYNDNLIPCKEAGLKFSKGEILQIVNREDPNWWQVSVLLRISSPAVLFSTLDLANICVFGKKVLLTFVPVGFPAQTASSCFTAANFVNRRPNWEGICEELWINAGLTCGAISGLGLRPVCLSPWVIAGRHRIGQEQLSWGHPCLVFLFVVTKESFIVVVVVFLSSPLPLNTFAANKALTF